jgi:Putative porin
VIFKKYLFLLVPALLLGCVAYAQEKAISKTDTSLVKRRVVKSSSSAPSGAPKKRMYSKIINDSTKNVYGPKTSLWTTENEIFLNKKNLRPLDFHRWTPIQKLENKYQDLGNIGTALNPIYPIVPSTIGASAGFTSYDPYYDTKEPRYYDTKSPFTRMYIVWSGNGRATTHIEFTRNITPRWNFGFNYRPILADKQIQRRFADRQTISQYYDFFTTYRAKNEKYFLAFNYRRIRHLIKENGGVNRGTDKSFSAFFLADAVPTLSKTETEDFRHNVHLHHSYQLAKPFQIYQTLDFHTRAIIFRSDASDLKSNYFKETIVDGTVTDQQTFKTFQNEAGVKGNAAFLFYNFYYKFRTVGNTISKLEGFDPRASSNLVEHYVGSKVALRFDSLSELKGEAELLLDGNYRLEGTLSTPWLDAGFISALTKPGYMQRAYRGSHNYWLNNFTNTFSNQLNGFLKINWRGLQFSPGVTYTILSDYVYLAEFKNAQLSRQSDGNQQVFSPELRFSLRFFKNFRFSTNTIYTQLWKNDDNVLRIPELFVNGQLAYHNFLFKKALQLELGIDVHYKSDYKAYGYAPDIQSYYVQDTQTIKGFPVVDVFLNAKIKGGRLFLKYHNAAQAFSTTGYMLTYGYPAVGNVIDFGFEIPLFD